MEETVQKRKKTSGILIYVLCLLVAVVLWLIVMRGNPLVTNGEYRDIPLTVVGAETLQDEGYDYVCATMVRSVVLQGTREDLYECTRNRELTAYIDLSGLPVGVKSASLVATIEGLPEGVTLAEPVTVSITFQKRGN